MVDKIKGIYRFFEQDAASIESRPLLVLYWLVQAAAYVVFFLIGVYILLWAYPISQWGN